MYEVLINNNAKRDLEKLPVSLHDRILEKIIALQQDPTPAGSRKLKGSATNYWRIRVGDYRVLYSVDLDSLQIEIMKVGHRREVYR